MVVFAGKTWSAFVLLQRAESGCQRMITGELQWSLLSCRCGAAVAHDNAEDFTTMFEPVVEVVMVSTVNSNVAGQLVGMVYMGGTSAGKLPTCNAVEVVLTPCMGLQLHVKIGEIEMHGSCLLLFKYPFICQRYLLTSKFVKDQVFLRKVSIIMVREILLDCLGNFFEFFAVLVVRILFI
ncbi:hypothetical protein PC112_g6852 [Phytophthora cactorum]|nr:hypothetical protein PC112_g6852 [Phytophthora cactorum]KAG3202163.1 hypothetical protein PC128_g3413 [Phytophthora cactorum]KAG4045568.1 hypothetical protein PC123_g19033 [Phytophthora cactorum]